MARTILVADDSPTIQKKASGILTGEGLDVVTVSNGVAAVKKLATTSPLVVLADVSMPGRDGYEVCEFVKASAEHRHVPVILIFSDVDAYEEARGARAQADGRIRKPFDQAELIAVVSKFVAQAEAAAAKPAPPPPPPAPEMVVAPVDEDPEVATKPEGPDLSELSEGVAFGVPGAEETPPAPAEAAPDSHPVPEEPAPSPEATAPAFAPPEIPGMEPPQEEAAVSDDDLLLPEEPEPSEPAPAAERTMMFRAPADIAQPVVTDEVAESQEFVIESSEAAEPEPVEPAAASRTLESYTLDDAATGQVRFEAAEAEAPPEVETTEEAAAPSESSLEAEAGPEAATEGQPEFEIEHEGGAAAPPPQSEFEIEHEGESAAPPPQPEFEIEHEGESAAPSPQPEFEIEHEGEAAVSPPQPEFEIEHEREVAAPPPEPEFEIEHEPEARTTEEAAAPLEPTLAAEAAAPAPESAISPEQVYAIVQKVVAKMSPAAFPPQMIEDMARRFTDEITAELNSES